jgi:hypothetical protein
MNWMLLATVGSMLAFWVTALFILYQIRHMAVTRNVEVTMRMFEWAESNRMREAMRWVNNAFDYAAFRNQPDAERSDFPGLLIAFFEQAGIMIEKRFVNEDVVLDNLGLDALRVWARLKPLVEQTRQDLDDARFGEHFEFLCRRARAYETRLRQDKRKNP